MRSSLIVLLSALLLPAVSAQAIVEFFWANPRPTGSALGGVDFESPMVGYAVGDFGTCLRTVDAGVTWANLISLSPTSPALEDLLVLAPGSLLAAGASPGLHRSTDGGLSWSPVANPANEHLRNLFALDASTIFAVGDAGRVIRSTNGGSSWALLTAPLGAQLVDQWWLDASNGYVIGQSCVRRTTNGGTTWSTIPGIPEFNVFFPGDIQFTDSLNGLIFTDFDTFRTLNGGLTWTKVPVGFGMFPIYQEEAIILGPQTRLVATEAEGANIWKTTNDGTTWTNVLDHQGTRGVTDLERLPSGAIVAITTDGDLLRSTDDGASWSNFTHVAGAPERENTTVLDVHESGLGFAAGYGTGWMQTNNFGFTWFTPAATPGVGGIFAIKIRDESFALVGGSGSGHDVRRTTDGGATWTSHDLAPSYVGTAQGLAAFSDGTCFCGTYGGTSVNFVFRSTDNGTTWHLRNNGVPANMRIFDLFFLDSQRGFVCGGDFSDPAIYRTTDGGGQWTAVGESGLMGSEIRDMHWFDGINGLVVNGAGVQRTTNGGATWVTVSGSPGGEAIDFHDALHGVVDRFPDDASTTTDGGATWTPISLPISGYISDVAMTEWGFLVSGGSNSILASVVDAVTASPEIPASRNVGPARLLVWPNPLRVGRSTEMSFRIDGAAGSPAEARLYDVGGRLLARTTLEASSRTGSLALPAGELSPGVLFLEIRGTRGERIGGKIAVIR